MLGHSFIPAKAATTHTMATPMDAGHPPGAESPGTLTSAVRPAHPAKMEQAVTRWPLATPLATKPPAREARA